MTANEQPKGEAQSGPEEDKTRSPAGEQPDSHELPLFLRGISDGRKGNAQDEKDGVGE